LKPVEKRQFCELMGRTEGIEMKGCADVPFPGIAPAETLQGEGLHPMHREIFGGKDAWWRARIVVIGRDGPTTEALQRLLRAAGLGARVFASAEEFLGSEQVQQTDCVLLNTSLPAMDCPDLAERLRGVNVALPIIVVTSPSTFGQLVNLSSLGVVACLASPVEWDTLRLAISAALKRS
jgi:CheY-like chemotaxis protein